MSKDHDPDQENALMMETYGLLDLVAARVAAQEHADDADELRFYYRGRARALSRAFGVPGEQLPGPTDAARSAGAVQHLLEESVRARETGASPFWSFVEAPESVIALYQRFGRQLNDAATVRDLSAVRALIDDLMPAAASVLWDVPEGRTVTRAEVARHGFDPGQPVPQTLDFDEPN